MEQQNDLSSVNLLLLPSPDQRSHSSSSSSEEEESRRPSPATQTLNAFSQPQLRVSQIELDAASALMQARSEDPSAFGGEDATRAVNDRGSKTLPSMTDQERQESPSPSDHDDSSSSSDEEEVTDRPQSKGRKRKMTSHRAILQLNATTGKCLGRFQSFRAITIATGVHYTTIRGILEGRKSSIRGWTFRYEGDSGSPLKRPSLATDDQKPATTKDSPNRKIKISQSTKQEDSSSSKIVFSTRAHPVEQIRVSTGKVVGVHRSLTSAEGATGIQRQIISKIVKGELPEHDGWTFRRIDMPTAEATTNPTPEPCGNDDKLIEQIEVATGRVVATHSTFTAAGEAVHCRRQLVSKIVNGEDDEVNGWTFRLRAPDPSETAASTKRQAAQTTDSASSSGFGEKIVEVIKIATGECVGKYPTFTAAAKALGCDRRVLSKIANGLMQEYNGCTVRVQSVDGEWANVQESGHARSVSSKTVDTPTPSSHANYEFIPITVKHPGALGLNVKREDLSEHLQAALRAYDPQCGATCNGSMRAMSFKKESALAGRYGIKKGDMMFLKNEDKSIETAYNRVASAIKGGSRPLSLIVARATNHQSGRTSPNENADTSNTRQSNPNRDLYSDQSQPSSRGRPSKPTFQRSNGSSGQNQHGKQSTMRRLSFQTTEKSCAKPLMPIIPVGSSPGLTTAPPKPKHMRLTSEADSKPLPLGMKNLDFQMKGDKSRKVAVSVDMKNSLEVKGANFNERNKQKVEKHPAIDIPDRKLMEAPKKGRKPVTVVANKQCQGSYKNGDISSRSSDTQAPFCLVCNGSGKANAFHHCWCPKHPDFEKSGATDIYDRIISGCAIGCPVCQKEYETGRRCKEAHTLKCQEIESKKLAKSRQTHTQESENETQEFFDVVSEDETTADIDDDEISAYQHQPANHRKKFNKLTLVEDTNDEPKEQSTKGGTKKGTLAKGGKTSKVEKKKPAILSSSKRSTDEVMPPKEAENSQKESHDSSNQAEKDITSGISWKCSTNPWGETDHSLDDCVVLSQKWNHAHHDYMLPTPRYTFNPFESDCYSETHKNPLEHGFHVLNLKRDALGSLPWGFTLKRHDFGGACIVATVDPMSPAASAVRCSSLQVLPLTFARKSIVASGGTLLAPVAVHDIVISIDGKCVGGMSELSVKLLLEASGSNLTITVARYLFNEKVRKQATCHESKMLTLKDAEIADKRTMDWIDSGVQALEYSNFSIKCPTFDVFSEENATRSEDEGKLEVTSRSSSMSSRPKALPLPLPTASKSKRSRKGNAKNYVTASIVEDKSQSTTSKSKKPGAPTVTDTKKAHLVGTPRIDHHAPAVNVRTSSPGPNASSAQDSDDGNAWFNCICQKIHDETVPLFWIQCGVCCSWYNVARGCIGFGEEQAGSVVWICPGCPTDEPQDEQFSLLVEESIGDNLMASFLPASPTKPFFPESPDCAEKSCNSFDDASIDAKFEASNADLSSEHKGTSFCQHSAPKIDIAASIEDEKEQHESKQVEVDKEHFASEHVEVDREQLESKHGIVFEVGDRVNVEQHSWARVNNPKGLAVIRRAYRDDTGNPIYDIKYVIEKMTKKAVEQKYLKLSSLSGTWM